MKARDLAPEPGLRRKRAASRFKSSTALLGAAMALSACTAPIDLGAVQQYAKTTAAAAGSFDELAGDYYQSCLRTKEYAEPASVGGRPLSSKLPARPPAPPIPKPGQTPQPLNPQALDPDCTDASSIAYAWRNENAVVVNYVRSLGYVAGVDTKPDFDDLASSLKNAGVLRSDATATAASNLAAALATGVIAARQQAALRQIVQSAQDNGLPTLVAGLQSIAQIYIGKLARERTSVGSYYDVILGGEQRRFAQLEYRNTLSLAIGSILKCGANLGKRMTTSGAARAAELRDAMRRQRIDRLAAFSAIDSQVRAATAYQAAIAAIGDGNGALLKVPSNDIRAIVATIKPYVDLLQDKVAALSAALRK